MTERMIRSGDVHLCTESFGDPDDPPVLLIMGMGASMLWWDEAFCHLLADGGRFVIRYDHRDTGLSTSYPLGHPGYTDQDLVDDAARVLEAHDLAAAHVVGISAGGGLAQLLTLDHPERVFSLVLISTSRAVAGEQVLPPPSRAFLQFASTVDVDWSDTASIADYLVGYEVMLSGTELATDIAGIKGLVSRDIARSGDIRLIRNHDLLEDTGAERLQDALASITAPTLVVHGTADPLFPPEHGRTLGEEIPGARFHLLEGAGHGLHGTDWEVVARLVLDHTRNVP